MSLSDEQITSLDAEKGTRVSFSPNSPIGSLQEKTTQDATLDFDVPAPLDNKFFRGAKRVEHVLGLEARGIHRVKSNEQTAKTTLTFTQIVVLWISINTAAQNITLGSIGQSVFGLGFVDAALCSVLGAVLGCIPVAYVATWGARSGNRTLVGYLPRTLVVGLMNFRSVPDILWGGGLSNYVFF
jgi:hypothetical protein